MSSWAVAPDGKVWDAGRRIGRQGAELLVIRKRLETLRNLGFSWLRVAAIASLATFAAGEALAVTSAAIVVDAKTGKVLYSSNADTKAYPASLTKMMTLYLTFEALEARRISLDTRIRVSSHAAAQPPSKLGLKAGQTITVKDAILSLITRSANDMATALAEHLAGSESAFAVKMTARARSLGMRNTTFKNANGLPNTAQVTTARDMALLGRALQDRFPTYFRYFKTTSFTYNGAKIGNHNRLLGKVEGVDGIKTGYTRASGFNLVTSVNRGDRRLVAVVLGGSSGSSRDARMQKLIEEYIRKASRGPRTAPLVLPTGVSEPIDPPELIAELPAPRLRPDSIVTAYAAEATGSVAAAAAVTDIATLVPEEFRAQGDIAEDQDAATAEVSPPPPAPIADVPANAAERLAAVPTMDGWKIQLAAAPTQAAALAILDKARNAGSQIIADAAPYTEPVEKGSETLYRARFVGFAGKEEAQAACAYLVKRKFACYAIAE
ncbi:MAG TPA: D-alanyl-D-alanine carboxypeptidase family protein [Bauldia sp.]|nr:D-alanyl-D-alanine carboxypeptidase family protein [Bauldia sp.]